MARTLTLPAALLVSLGSLAWEAAAEPVEVLQYDALIEGETKVGSESMRFGLFLRYHLHPEATAGEVVHYEPGWNHHAFTWNPLGLAFHTDDEGVTIVNTFRDKIVEAPTPQDERAPAGAGGYPPSQLAYSATEFQARIHAFREAFGGLTTDEAPVHIDFEDDRIARVTWEGPLAGDFQTNSDSQYTFDAEGNLDTILVHSLPVSIPAEGTKTLRTTTGGGPAQVRTEQMTTRYPNNGRTTRIEFDDVALGTGTIRMPMHIDVSSAKDGDFVRSARHYNFAFRTIASGEARPWDTWENARLSEAEAKRIWLLADERYWLGDRVPSAEHAAFFASFVVPLDELEDTHDEVAFRLRAFFHAYNAAMVLGDEAYLTEGFPWYLAQIAFLDSPALMLHAGQECIRLLLRWGYTEVAETAIHAWREAVFALEEDAIEALEEYSRQGIVYYAFRLFEEYPAADLTPARKFHHHYFRCMALKRWGLEPARPLYSRQGRATPDWTEMTASDWTELVVEEHAKAMDLYSAIESPSLDDRRKRIALETLIQTVTDGTGFVAFGLSL